MGSKVPQRQHRITAADSAGLFYARQTLLQLLTAKGIPCVKITDNPRFGYRGIHLDVSRHFFAKEEVFKILDEMARYKLNVFHLHLTDNGGWRIQIDRYPLLTRLGLSGRRPTGSSGGNSATETFGGTPGPMAVIIRRMTSGRSWLMLRPVISR